MGLCSFQWKTGRTSKTGKLDGLWIMDYIPHATGPQHLRCKYLRCSSGTLTTLNA